MLFNSEAHWIPGEENPGLAQVTNFVESCLGKAELFVKPEEAMRVSQIIDAIYESSYIGKRIPLKN